jgi:hypothetical protein
VLRLVRHLLRNGLIRGYGTVPHIPDPRELPQLISYRPAVSRRMRHWALVDSPNN